MECSCSNNCCFASSSLYKRRVISMAIEIEIFVDSFRTKGYFIKNSVCELHREDGPAIMRPDGELEWYYLDQKIDWSSQEEFEKF